MNKDQIIEQNNLKITTECNPANDLDTLCCWAVSRSEMTEEDAVGMAAFFGQPYNKEEEDQASIDRLAHSAISSLTKYNYLYADNEYLHTCKKLLWLALSYPEQLEETLKEIAQNFNDPYAVFRD